MRLTVTLPAGCGKLLTAYAAYKITGDTVEETASFLLMRAIGDIVGTPGFHHLLNEVKSQKPKS